MDARLDPAKFAGLAEGDAHVIRNAGGRASDDAIRSLVISYKLLGTREFFVIHHTDCGMQFFTDEVMRELLAASLETAELTSQGFKDVGRGPGSRAAASVGSDSTKHRESEESSWTCMLTLDAPLPECTRITGEVLLEVLRYLLTECTKSHAGHEPRRDDL